MALDFLRDAVSIASGIAGLTRKTRAPRGTDELMAANSRLMQQYEEDRAKRNELLGRAGTMDLAAISEQNPMFQALARREGSNIRGDFIKAMNDLRTQNLKSRARQTPGFFVNPERRDEAVSQAIGRRFDSAQGDARNAARGYLHGVANAMRSTAGAYQGNPSTSGFAQSATLYGQADARRNVGRDVGMAQILRGIESFANRTATPAQPAATGRPRQRTGFGGGTHSGLTDPSGRPLDYYFNPDALRVGTLS